MLLAGGERLQEDCISKPQPSGQFERKEVTTLKIRLGDGKLGIALIVGFFPSRHPVQEELLHDSDCNMARRGDGESHKDRCYAAVAGRVIEVRNGTGRQVAAHA